MVYCHGEKEMGRVEYFEQVLNVAVVREANINVVGNWRMLVLGDLNEKTISLEEVGEAVNEIKSGKASGLDAFPLQYNAALYCSIKQRYTAV